VLFHLFLKLLCIPQFVQSHVCFYVLDWSAIYVNIGGIQHGHCMCKMSDIKRTILLHHTSVLTSLGCWWCQVGRARAAHILLYLICHNDWKKWLYWIKFPWTVIDEVCTIVFCRSCSLVHFGDVRCLLLIGSDSSHFGNIAFVKKATLIRIPPSFHPRLSPKSLTTSPQCPAWSIYSSFGDRSIYFIKLNVFNF